MESLDHLAAGSLAVTSQDSGNMMSGRPLAMSAPGTEPVTPLPPAKDQGDPAIGMISHARTVLEPGAAPREPNPWTKADGTVWADASPDVSGGNAAPGPWGQQ